jgi:hypothetical protein
MKNLFPKITGLLTVYRSAKTPGLASNASSAIAFVIAMPSVFIMPVFHSVMLCFTPYRAIAKQLLPLSLFNLLISPLLAVYVIALPLFGRRLYLTTPAGRALTEVKKQINASIREQNRQA